MKLYRQSIVIIVLMMTSLLNTVVAADRLETLETEHPRLVCRDARLSEIKTLIEHDDQAKAIFQSLVDQAEDTLTKPLVRYHIPDGKRLLQQSRLCVERIYLFGLLYRLTEEEKYLNRAKQELFAASEFKDWNPSHFLDTAEMSHAFGIGYDWLYHDLSDDDREIIRNALVEKGLNAYMAGWENNAWWTTATHNWNQVCHGGIAVGALALADEMPDLANEVIDHAVEAMPRAIRNYGPDGGWDEGPGYWHYATRYTVYALAAMKTALGTDFGLSEIEGFERAGDFRIHFVGPTNMTFNYADARNQNPGTHELFWLAKRFDRPEYAYYQRQNIGSPHALDLIWFEPEGSANDLYSLPLNDYYRNIEVAFLRSEWNNPNAIWVGFKGGDNQANHGHLDLGTFVLDALNERWSVDLGADNYNLPGYFGSQRWDYFLNNTHSHSTLIINEDIQNTSAKSEIIQFEDKSDHAFAIADLSEAYQDHAKSVKRGIALIDQQHVLVQDEISANEAIDVQWGMMTRANAMIDENGATLFSLTSGKKIRLEILEPENGYIELYAVTPPEPQKRHPGVQKVVVRHPDKQQAVRFAILLSPIQEGWNAPDHSISVKPLDNW